MKSILIIRLSAIGDVVMASPLIRCLRARYPQAHIAWLVQPEAQGVLSANPMLDEVIVWPRSEWRKLWRDRQWIRLAREVTEFVRQLRARKFNMAIDIQGLLKSGIWARLSGAPERIGLGSKEGSALLMNRVIDKPKDHTRIGSEYRHLAHVLGLNPGAFEMDVALSDEDRRFADLVIQRNELMNGYVVICPFTTRPQKHWTATSWPDLASRIQKGFGIRTVLLGGPGDSEGAQRMTAGHQHTMINMTGQTGIRQAAAIISKATLLVGVDTGLTHMGIAFNVPAIAIFGSTCPYLETGRSNTIIIYKNLECSPCGRHPTCGGRYQCMTSVTVDEVVASAARLIKTS